MIKVFTPDINWRQLWLDYRSEFFFGAVLGVLVVFSYWAASYIPESIFETFINPVQCVVLITVCLYGAFLMFRHQGENQMRRSWGWVLLSWAAMYTVMLSSRYGFGYMAVGGTLDDPLYNTSLTIGNMFAWLLFIYPSQVLRPGWLNWKKALIVVLPMIIVGVIDCFVPANLIYIIMLYPIAIFYLLCRHIREYRRWCEDNFSSMDNIDVQWIVRYLIMLAVLGLSFYFIVFRYVPNRMFTQQWVFLLILGYSTEQILFRKDPWEELLKEDGKFDNASSTAEASWANRQLFEQWMAEKKPYLNPDFQLNDLRAVLPMNRTYLSQFVNSEYGCSFYMLVNRYRIAEAKRLMTEQPDLKIQDIADRCGFSSRRVFSQIFTRETGTTPTEWK
jgi:AraC-like DNA-binding protein